MPDDRTSSAVPVIVPVLITLVALVILLGAQVLAAFNDHGNLQRLRDGQTSVLQQDANMRQQVTILAGGVARLAQSGDADAQAVVANFAKSGVRFAPPKESTTPTGG